MNLTDEEILWLAALLHDIGKFSHRTRTAPPYGAHEEHGRCFVEEMFGGFFAACGGDLPAAIGHHHPRESRATREIEKQVMLADRLSAQEREREDREREEPSLTPLVSPFSRLAQTSLETPERRFSLAALRLDDTACLFPSESPVVNPATYEELWRSFCQEMTELAGERSYQASDLTTLLALLHKYTALMPAATPWEGQQPRTVPDVSLYNHLRTTAAIAACLYRELDPDELDAAVRREPAFQERPLAALVKGDVSGTQDFLYLLTSQGAARGLRGRSFYLQLLTETVARWILRQLHLPPMNLLFVGGGHFYLLLPWKEAEKKLPGLNAQLAEKLWAAHQGDLSLILGWVPIRAADLAEREQGEHAFGDKWDEVSQRVNEAKQRKWQVLGETMFERLFTAQEVGGVEDVCDVCRFEGDLMPDEDAQKCQRCRGFEELGRLLRQPRYLVTFDVPEGNLPEHPDWRDVLRTFGAEVWIQEDAQRPTAPPEATAATVTTLNSMDFLTPEVRETFRWEGLPVSYDFCLLAQATPQKFDARRQLAVATFEDLAEASDGVKWLGVLRMDVDDLGKIFREGLGGRATISRMSTLSEFLSLFFQAHVSRLCESFNGFDAETGRGEDPLFLIYAGGDDLFVVGAWSALPQLARKIRGDFRRYVGGDHVTLSGGIAIEHQKYPLYQLAAGAKHALDDQAKEYRREGGGRRKDALCFLQTPMGWEQFAKVEAWQGELRGAILPSDRGTPLPRGFLTRLGEIYGLYAGNAARVSHLERYGGVTLEKMKEMMAYDKWRWRLVYHLSRFAQRYEHHKPLIEELQRALVKTDLIVVLHVLARWVQLATREVQ